jgi:hypothetical protein
VNAAPAEPQPLYVPDPPDVPFDVQAAMTRTRERLAYGLLALFALSIAAAVAYISTSSWDNAKEFLQIALPAEIGLLGSVMGFYFGTEAAAGGDGGDGGAG